MDDEIQIKGGESFGDEFYEKIEAPKFVDLAKPDHYLPESGDRYWFCLRVGCHQKHEEGMDSEAIYKNFVLRVMAARSPNIRLRKELYGKDSSTNVKCPLTVPAKSSNPRVSRLALVSSISQKMADRKVKGRPLFMQCETPKKKGKQSFVAAKALTTPRNKKRLSNLGTFQSTRNPKPTALTVPENRKVVTALVFHSPKKTVRMNLKKSAELSASMRKLCVGLKKLEITSGNKHISGCNQSLPVDASRKRFRGREVKSRVYDSLHPRNCQGKEAKPSKCLKKKNEKKELQMHFGPAPCDRTENDSSDMEIEKKSRDGSLEVHSTSGVSKNNEGNQHEECLETQKTLEFPSSENKSETISDASGSDSASIIHCKERNTGDNDVDQKDKLRPEKQIKSNVIETDENDNASVSDDKENENEVVNHDDKENASASNDNRKLNPNTSHVEKEIVGKHETSKGNQIVTKGTTKTSKGNSTADVNCAEGRVNYRKPKLTNPKPFRLRTDERRILKEANLEKKLHLLEPLQERTTKRIHQAVVLRNEKCLERTEYAIDAQEGSEKESNTRTRKDQRRRRGTSNSQTSKAAAERKESTTSQRNTVSVQQKTELAASRREFSQDKTANKSRESFKKTKSLCMKQVARTQGIEQPSKRKTISLATLGRLGVIKESSATILRTKVVAKPMESVTSPATKASSSSTPRPSLLGRKYFHNVRVPKSSCTRRVA